MKTSCFCFCCKNYFFVVLEVLFDYRAVTGLLNVMLCVMHFQYRMNCEILWFVHVHGVNIKHKLFFQKEKQQKPTRNASVLSKGNVLFLLFVQMQRWGSLHMVPACIYSHSLLNIKVNFTCYRLREWTENKVKVFTFNLSVLLQS